MRNKKMISRNRRDFVAIYECEHCEGTIQQSGYDDRKFHHEVMQAMLCEHCEKTSPPGYRPQETRYPEHMQV